jgi:hypothetical protein
MKKKIYVLPVIFILSILALSKSSTAQIRFEVDLPGIKIVAGEPYPVVIERPVYVYYEPLPEGYYYYDSYNHCYYDSYGRVYYYPSNVYIRHDKGKHKGWHKKKHRHEHEYEDEDEHDDD